ncbi:hypothetical protein ACIPSK_10490 [Rhizobium sp. LARHSG275]|uniref:hypothetical protein n=1 Tax=Rhizobium TaxID=379 RepID=UPI001FEECF85|nr:hypothetical protein [Rhizobium laguerreae]
MVRIRQLLCWGFHCYSTSGDVPRVAFFGPDEAYAGDHITYQNGMMTWWGLLETVKSLAVTAVFGFAAGGLFWLVAAAGVKRQPVSETIPSKVFE